MAKQVTITKYVSELTEEMINEGWNRCGKLNDKLMVLKEDNVSENSDTLNEVISDMIAREKLGIKKYGTTIDRDDYDLKDWLQHALEEAMDSVLYLKKAIQQLQKIK